MATGWTPERREAARQRMYRVKPWLKATGPKTERGKARCSLNALRHGLRSTNLALRVLGTLAIWERDAREASNNLTQVELEAMKALCPDLLSVRDRILDQ